MSEFAAWFLVRLGNFVVDRRHILEEFQTSLTHP